MSPVLLISYSGALGGAERVLIEFATALEGDLCLACPEGPLAVQARMRAIRVLPLRNRPLDLRARLSDRIAAGWRLACYRREVRALVRDLDPALVIGTGMRSALALLLPRPPRGAPPIVFAHHDMLPGPLIGSLVRAATRRAALVIVPSRAVALDLGPRVPALVVNPGIEPERFADDAEPQQPPVVLLLGALVGWKRPQLALEAIALVRRRMPDVRLRLVGAPLGSDGDRLVAELLERAAKPDLAGAVELVGAVADPVPELARASCLLHCAPREPFGMVVIEALAAGRPVIAPASAGPQEIVDDGCGILYPPGDAGAAARAVLRVLEEPGLAAAMGAAGRARAADRFGLEQARERFVAAIAPLTGGRHDGVRPARAGTDAVALVTVTHNSAAELEALLASVSRHLPGARVVVVDCASRDGTVAVARSGRDRVRVDVIALAENVGFGAACNAGVRTVTEPVVALVNPDVELLDDSLLVLADEVRRRERLLAPLVLSPDGSRQDTVHPLPASPPELVSAVVPPLAVPGRLGAALAPWRSTSARRVGWAVGCALVARTETLLALGPFDERTFLYGEDLELGLRAHCAGIETWFWPRARVLHVGAHSTGKAFSSEPFELLARARHDAVARGLGPRRARIDDRVQAATFASRILLKRALGRDTGREQRQLAAVRSVPRGP